MKGIINGLLGFVEGMINGVIKAINKFIGGFSGIVEKAAAFIGIEWGGITELPPVTLPRLATGGIVTAPTILEAGEGGEPEAILPLSKLAALLEKREKGNRGKNSGGVPEPQRGEERDRGPQTAGGEQIVFSPVFNFYAPTSKEEAQEAARLSFAEFKRMWRQLQAEDRRKNFNPA